MSVNIFIAAFLVVLAVMVSIAGYRFFFPAQPAQVNTPPAPTEELTFQSLQKRLAVSAILTVIVLVPALIDLFVGNAIPDWMVNHWLQLVFITPVMFYGGYPIFIQGWWALRSRRPDMDTLAATGAIASYTYSLLATLAPGWLPANMRVGYFEVTGVIITVVLAAHWLDATLLTDNPAIPLEGKVNAWTRVLVPIFFLIAIWTFVLWVILGPEPSLISGLVTGVSVLIIACPCALGWASPLATKSGMLLANRNHIWFHTSLGLRQGQNISVLFLEQDYLENNREACHILEHAGVNVFPVTAQNARKVYEDYVNDQEIEHTKDGARRVTACFGSNDCVDALRDRVTICIRHLDSDPHNDLDGSSEAPQTSCDISTRWRSAVAVGMIMRISKVTMRNIEENLWWSFIFNLVGVVVAAGILYPFTGWMLNPMLACVAMLLSSICVYLNSLRLRSVHLFKS